MIRKPMFLVGGLFALCLFATFPIFLDGRKSEEDRESVDPKTLSPLEFSTLEMEQGATPSRVKSSDVSEGNEGKVDQASVGPERASGIDKAFLQVKKGIEDAISGNFSYESLLAASEELLKLEVSTNVYLGADVGDGVRFPLVGTPDGVTAFLMVNDKIDQIALEVKFDTPEDAPYFVSGVPRETPTMSFGGRFDENGQLFHCEVMLQMGINRKHSMALGINPFDFPFIKHGAFVSFPIDNPYSLKFMEMGTKAGSPYHGPSISGISDHPSISMERLNEIGIMLAKLRGKIYTR